MAFPVNRLVVETAGADQVREQALAQPAYER